VPNVYDLEIHWENVGCILAWILVLHTARAATFQVADPAEFNRIINTNAVFVTNAFTDVWLEGPTWIPSAATSSSAINRIIASKNSFRHEPH